MKMSIQERYRKSIEEFVQRALKEYKNKISKFDLEFVKKGFVEDIYGHALSHAKDRRANALFYVSTV